MGQKSSLDWIAYTLVVIGGLNWGLVGFFSWDLVATIFGDMSSITKVIYALVGLSALYMLVKLFSSDDTSASMEE